MIGRQLSHYRLLEKLGEGGMSVVYLAQDEHLDRRVALKLLKLPPTGASSHEATRQRLKHEALLLSRLSHPRIEAVYDFDAADDIDFLVVEYVPGETLEEVLAKGPLPEEVAVRIAIQIAEGLEEAHRLGIAHRDLKPGNVVITPRGQVKLLDFGISKLVRKDADAVAQPTLTETAAVVGTLPYMAPEQLLGKPVDHRIDHHALGVILYEMVAGRRPFENDSTILLANAILSEAPQPPSRIRPGISTQLEAVILRCLEKDPEARHRTSGDLLADLQRCGHPPPPAAQPTAARARLNVPLVAAAAVVVVMAGVVAFLLARTGCRPSETPVRSLAVLPLENLSAEPGQEYFTDAMTDELTTSLAQVRALRVISRTSAMRFKGVRRSLPDIARQLNVDAVVEGSVLRIGDQIRITAQLIHARSDRHMWAASYDREFANALALQREVAKDIAEQVRVQLAPREKSQLAKARAANPEAQEAYFQGRFYANKATEGALLTSINFFNHAADLDSAYAPAYAGLAESYVLLGNSGGLPAKEAFGRAEKAASQALALDAGLAEAHAALACIRFLRDWDWRGAEREFKRALELSPSGATCHSWYSSFLSAVGRHDLAIAEARRAEELDPLSLAIKLNVGMRYYYARQPERALERCEQVLAMDPQFEAAHYWLGMAYGELGNYGRAIAHFERLGGSALGPMGHAYAVSGQPAIAQKMLDEVSRRAARGEALILPFDMATICAGLGQKDRAFQWLERSLSERSPALTFLKVDPALDTLRTDPRFADLVRRIGAPS